MKSARDLKFYHDSTCKTCNKHELIVNTHRTDFVGYEKANKTFSIFAKRIYFPYGGSIGLTNDMATLRSLASDLMDKQGQFFFLNEYPEECEHRQYIDIDAPISDELLADILSVLKCLTSAKVLVLRNTFSNKVHLVIDVRAYTWRVTVEKRAISKWLCNFIFENAYIEAHYTLKEWQEDIFDLKA